MCRQYLNFSFPQTTCDPNGNACVERIKIDTGACQVPCEGTFVDVRKTDPGSFKVDNTDMFLKRYENYKKFYEKSSGNARMYILYHKL